MPTSNILANVFGRSPIGPVKEHITTVHACASQLDGFFAAVFKAQWEEAERIQQVIKQLEHKADEQKRDIRLSLPKSLFLPVPRGDLLKIVALQDKIANQAKDIAGLVLGRKMVIPEPMKANFATYLNCSLAASAQAAKAMGALDSLLETGFQGREVEHVERMVYQVDQLESDSDREQVNVRQILFRDEATLPPVDVMFLYKVIDWVGDLADRASRVCNHLQLLLAR